MQFFWNSSTDPAFNLALEDILTSRLRGDAFMLWQNRPAIIVGCNQNTHAEINSDFVDKRNIDVIRRSSGGGAVYHDLGNLNYSCFSDAPRLRFDAFEAFTQPVLRALERLGVHAAFSGRNDLLVGDRKISGSAKRFIGDRVLFHGTLLFDTNLDILAQALNPRPEKFAAKGIRSVRARVANLREFMPDLDTPAFIKRFSEELIRNFGLEQSTPLPPEMLDDAQRLANEKYRTWEWNYGNNPAFDFNAAKRFPGGWVELGLRIRNGRIAEVQFSGDFFGERPVSEIYSALRGIPFRRKDIDDVLAALPLNQYFMGISADELLSLWD